MRYFSYDKGSPRTGTWETHCLLYCATRLALIRLISEANDDGSPTRRRLWSVVADAEVGVLPRNSRSEGSGSIADDTTGSCEAPGVSDGLRYEEHVAAMLYSTFSTCVRATVTAKVIKLYSVVNP